MKVKFLNVHQTDPARIPVIFSENGTEYHDVRCVNWPEQYPDCPEFSVGMAYTPEGILVHYKVTEDNVRAVTDHDFGPVWEDSCVEFFFSPGGDSFYYNVECNCIGSLHVASGSGRHGRTNVDPGTVKTIRRWASLGVAAFGEKNERTFWEVALVIPYTVFVRHRLDAESIGAGTANVYECLGAGEHQHYLSLHPIQTENPDFHRPEFFREITFGR